ncbi:MAG TPA: DHH family phosphoesterase [Candidatus Saccharimonadales bacterium]|jgi:inorganic pyrophosphatase/exopolyphosphatase|nr:DHH family phosphoesterase [Candidatus Saccharimonadales bacterium]
MRIITSGYPYIDIDAYGAMVAYAALLNIQGQPAKAATSSKLNESIPVTLRNLHAPVELQYLPNPGESFTLVDISDPSHFDPIVNIDRLDEIIDHHPGTESYWRQYPRNMIDIEIVGSVCTMIYERWARAGLLSTMDRVSATLLAAGILDNTLNFQASISSERDKEAYRDLQGIAHLTDSWPAQYFGDCQEGIERDLETAIRNDIKVLEFKGQPNVYAVGQIVIWDAQSIINDHIDTITRTVSSVQPAWFMNVVSIKGDKSYFVCDNPDVQNWLSSLLGIRFSGNVAPATRLWLRKEIMIQALKQHNF